MGGSGFRESEPSVVGLTEEQLRAQVQIDIEPELVRLGYEVVQRQKSETFRQSWANHWRAAAWSVFITLALLMEGYDTSLLSSFFGLPQFLDSFGVGYEGKKVIPADYQGGLQNTVKVGQLIGLAITGTCQERYGSKRTYIGGRIAMTAAIFLPVFAVSLDMILVAQLVKGIERVETLTTAYAAEICPIAIRGHLATLASMGWGGGGFIGSGVLRGCLGIPNEWAWKIPFAVQWVWPVPLALGCFFAPESAWWLVRQGRFEKAEKTLKRTASRGVYVEREAEGFVAYMRYTDALEKVEAANGSWVELFKKGSNLRRTEVMIGTWLVQIWNGNMIAGLTVQLSLKQAGMGTTEAFNFNIILDALGIVGVMMSWVFLSWFGRRHICLSGILLEACCLLPIGVLGFVAPSDAVLKTLGGLLTSINLIFHFSLGPVCYAIVAELPSARLRSRSIVLGRFTYVCSAIAAQQLNVRMVASDGFNWPAKSGLFWLGCNAICFTWAFFRLPETGGFSFAELDILFANRVPARKFKKAAVKDEAGEFGLVDVQKEADIKKNVEDDKVEDVAAGGVVDDKDAKHPVHTLV